jgi:DNA-binding transcriptional ArsR family regulator
MIPASPASGQLGNLHEALLDRVVSISLLLAMTYAEALSALADPTRRRIFEGLRRRPKTVGELAQGRSVSRPAVSQHLKVLKAAKLVRVEPQGNRRLYLIRRDGLNDLRRYLESFWSDALTAYGAEIARRVKES